MGDGLYAIGMITRKFTGVVHVPEFVATLWADGEVVIMEHDERAAIVARRAVFDDVDAHKGKYDIGVPQGCA